MKNFFKKNAIALTTVSALLLAGCNDESADNFIGQWSGDVVNTVANSTTSVKITLDISTGNNLVVVKESINSVYQREGIRDRVRDSDNTYNLVALSETELGEPGVGENPDNVIYNYNENDDTIIYKHTMIDGSHEVALTRD